MLEICAAWTLGFAFLMMIGFVFINSILLFPLVMGCSGHGHQNTLFAQIQYLGFCQQLLEVQPF